MNNRTEKPRPSGVSRRTVVKGAAWAVPAITVATAVPALAASGDYPVPGDNCKDASVTSNLAFRLYIVGATSTITFTSSSPVSNIWPTPSAVKFYACGVTLTNGTYVEADGVGTFTFTVTNLGTATYPYVVIGNSGVTNSGTQTITANQTDQSPWLITSNSPNCSAIGWNKPPESCATALSGPVTVP